MQTGGGAFPLPGSATVQHSHSDCATSGPCRWGGAARRTGRGRAQGDCPRPRAEPPGSFRPYAEYFYREAGRNLQHSLHSVFQHSMGSFQQGLLGHMQATMQPQRMHEEFGEPARMQPHMESYGAHMHAEYDEPARMGIEAQYTGFKRPRQLATQQSETAEEFRFMLPEQSQVCAPPLSLFMQIFPLERILSTTKKYSQDTMCMRAGSSGWPHGAAWLSIISERQCLEAFMYDC